MIPKSLRLRLLLGASALLLAGLAGGWLVAGSGPDAAKLAAPAENWQEPALRHADPAKSLASLAQHSLWGDGGPLDKPDAAAKPATAEWKLSGIVLQGRTPMAVILLAEAGKPASRVQNIKIGDELPDGSHLVEIAKTSITVAGEGGQRQVKMFLPN